MKMTLVITKSDVELARKLMGPGTSAVVLEGEDGGAFSDGSLRVPLSKWLWDYVEAKQAALPNTRDDKGRWI